MFPSFHGRKELWRYLGGLLSIMVDEGDLENRTKQWINYIILFNNEQLIQRYNINQSNIPEESRYISCLTPTGFINGQDESRCDVNLSFQVLYFDIFF